MELQERKKGRAKGSPKVGGRVAGTPNKITADIKALAGQYGLPALKELARIAAKGKAEATRVAACKEILDRAYGKAPQYVEQTTTNRITEGFSDLEVARRVAFLLTNAVEPPENTTIQ